MVSIEMIEAIGHRQYGEFFRQAAALLPRGGRMVLQTITIADHLYARTRDEVDFIKRYVFPGACIPSVSALAAAMAASGPAHRVAGGHRPALCDDAGSAGGTTSSQT